LNLPGNLFAVIVTAGVLIVLFGMLRWFARSVPVTALLTPAEAPSSGKRILLVMVHGMGGYRRFQSAVRLAILAMPGADVLCLRYRSSWLTNLSPYTAADVLEESIHRREQQYDEIVLVAHSAGAAIARKAFLWACDFDEDRGRQTQPRRWPAKVSRIVMLAGISRGIRLWPRPENRSWIECLTTVALVKIARLLGVCRFVKGFLAGEPFMADSRAQWLRLARSEAVATGARAFPTVIQLIGDRDSIVHHNDGMDLFVARGSNFKSLVQTSHAAIGNSLHGARGAAAEERRRLVTLAVQGDLDGLEPDDIESQLPAEDREVKRIVYVMHGIRDWGDWTDHVRRAIVEAYATQGQKVAAVSRKYGFFPMAPFLTYGDRQIKVRMLMDDYTENLARFPNAESIDYMGHSNGTYLLASALMHYKTMKVRRVFFAGSVVPSHYPWDTLIREGRVEFVVNVVATADWVVAFFPRLFELLAGWLNQHPTRGWWDLGGAGFRGFLVAGGGGAADKVENLNFSPGGHGTGLPTQSTEKMSAFLAYMVRGETAPLAPYKSVGTQDSRIAFLSNICFIVWIVAASLLALGGMLVHWLFGATGLAIYALLVLALLHSV
jgi:pimeloyl-ACP methyl ester carboxylesterase